MRDNLEKPPQRERDWLGELTALTAHRLCDPLTSIAVNAGSVKLMLEARGNSDDPMCAMMASIIDDARCAWAAMDGFREVLGHASADVDLVDVNDLLSSVEAYVRGLDALANVRIETAGNAELPCIRGSRDRLMYLVASMMMAASDAMEAATEPVGLVLKASANQGLVVLEISEKSDLISVAAANRLFELIHSDSVTHRAYGFTLCRSIVACHEGTISVDSLEGGRSVVRLKFPAFTS